MTPTTKLILLSLFLAYAGFRATVYFRKKRPQFGIAVLFVCAIVVYEIVRVIMHMASDAA